MPSSFRNEKVTDIIHHLAGEFISRESDRSSLVTVTHVLITEDAKEATILVTVLPESKEGAVVDFLKRMRKPFKQYVMQKSKIGRVPFFDFEIDKGQKQADAIYAIPVSGV